MGKDKWKAEVNDPIIVEDVDNSVDNSNPEQIKHTPMGTIVEPAKFKIGDKVTTTEEVDMDNIVIPEGIILTVMGIMGDDMYSLVGPEGLIIRQNGAYLEKIKEV